MQNSYIHTYIHTYIRNLLASHFTIVGLHENHHLAMYAIDSLKQLSIKVSKTHLFHHACMYVCMYARNNPCVWMKQFLQKEELSNFNFQRLFLKPFEKIMSASRSTETKVGRPSVIIVTPACGCLCTVYII